MKFTITLIITLLFILSSFFVVSKTSEEFNEEIKLPTDLIIEGPTQGKIGISYNYTIYLTDPQDCNYYLYVNWGDGTADGWIGPFDPYEEATLSHIWFECGIYYIWAVTKHCNETYISELFGVTICDNHPPNKPIIIGETQGKVGKSYTYTFMAEDPDEDNVSYYIDWGDGTNYGWSGYIESGFDICISHKWEKIDRYPIRCKAKDVYGFEGNWSDYQVEISKQRSFNFIFNILNQMDKFPFLSWLLECLTC